MSSADRDRLANIARRRLVALLRVDRSAGLVARSGVARGGARHGRVLAAASQPHRFSGNAARCRVTRRRSSRAGPWRRRAVWPRVRRMRWPCSPRLTWHGSIWPGRPWRHRPGPARSGAAIAGSSSRPRTCPPLQPGRVYQVWVLTTGAPISAGFVSPDRSGRRDGRPGHVADIPLPAGVAVSLEPAGGVPLADRTPSIWHG